MPHVIGIITLCADNLSARALGKADEVERIFIELMTSDRKLKASREGSK